MTHLNLACNTGDITNTIGKMGKFMLTVALLVMLSASSLAQNPCSCNPWQYCQEHKIDFQEFVKPNFECYKEKHKEDPHWEEIHLDTCVSVCAWKKSGLLDGNNKYNSTAAKSFLTKIGIPSNLVQKLVPKLDECNKEYGTGHKLTNDCEEFEDFQFCMEHEYEEVCGIELH